MWRVQTVRIAAHLLRSQCTSAFGPMHAVHRAPHASDKCTNPPPGCNAKSGMRNGQHVVLSSQCSQRQRQIPAKSRYHWSCAPKHCIIRLSTLAPLCLVALLDSWTMLHYI